MSTAKNDSHIIKIPTNRANLVAYLIDGHMTSDDITSVYTELLAIYKQHEKIDLLVKFENFDGFDWSAIFTDTTYAAKTQSLDHIRRYAIVGAPGWMSTIATAFDPFFSLELKSFELDEEEKAWAWLDEGSEVSA
jgi:hypothetical protein